MTENSLTEQFEPTISRILRLIEEIRRNPQYNLTSGADEILNKLEPVLEALNIFIETADPLLVSQSQMSNLSSNLSTIESNLQLFNSNHTTYLNYLQTIDSSYIDSIKNMFPYFLPKPSRNGLEHVKETVSYLRRSASQNLRSLTTEFEKKTKEVEQTYEEKHNKINETYENRLDEFENELKTKRDEFENELKTKQDEFDEKLKEALSEVESLVELSTETNEDIKSQKNRLDTAIAEFQKQFSERIGEYQRQFSDAEEERRKKLESSIQSRDRAYKKETTDRTNELTKWREDFTATFTQDKESFDKTSNELIEALRNYAQEAKVTVGLMSEKSLQNDYDLQAKEEKNRAWWWNVATFGTVGLLLGAVAYIFVHTIIYPLPPEQASYPQILSKFLITGVMGIVARWTSRQANRHLAEERRLRRLALELTTINCSSQDFI